MALDPTMTDEEQPDTGGAEEAQDAGTCYEILVYSDGRILVESEPIAEEEAEGEGHADAKPAKDIGEALKILLGMYRDGQAAAGGADDQMAAGFNRVRGGGL